MNASTVKRRIKLINPRLQLSIAGIFVGLAACSLIVQLFLLGMDLQLVAQETPESSLADAIPSLLLRSLLFTGGMWLPLTFFVGIVATHRIAGPLYRFEQHLAAVVRGENPGPCHIRTSDELQHLNRLINEALEATAERAAREATAAGGESVQTTDLAA